MFIRRAVGAVAVLAISGLGMLALAGPAQADTGHYPDAGWQVRQIGIGDIDWSPATASAVVDATTVALTKPDATTGTSIETTDLDLAVTAGTEIAVNYTLEGGADTAAGAVRMFYYDSADGDTLTVGPTAFVAADGSGTLSLAIGADTTIGTFGLVYDASNATAGTVTFTNLTVGDTPVRFTPMPVPLPGVEFEDHCDGVLVHLANGADAQADASFSVSGLDDGPFQLIPGLTPEALLVTGSEVTVVEEVTGEEWSHTWVEPEGCDEVGPSPEASEPPALGVAGGVDDDQLPVTGSGLVLPLVGIGGVLLIVGAVALAVVRRGRKRITFSA